MMTEDLIRIEKFPEGTSKMQVLLETAVQLNKDLGAEWIRVEKIPIDADANWLFNETKLLISELFNSEKSKLAQLLYRVDVSEREVKIVMQTAEINNLADQLAVMLVKREVQKVLFRLKIKSGTGI
ncbi:MAG: hypothetical protein ACI898_000302 [Flavobacteriales bacterium]|jgi:hypothetical protein